MGSPANTRASVGEILKNVYEPNINSAVKREVFFLHGIKKAPYDGKGKAYVFATHLKRNTAAYARAADDYFETAGAEVVRNGTVTPKYAHIPFEINADLMAASKGDKHAFVDGMKLVQQTAKEMLTRELNRYAVGDGRGILLTVTATVTGGSATAVVTCNSTKYLEEGMLLDIWAGATAYTQRNGAALVNGRTQSPFFKVDSITSDTQFVVSMTDGSNVPSGVVANDVAVRKWNAYSTGSARACYEPDGLRIMADDGTLDPSGGLHGISSTDFGKWKGINKDGSGYDASPAMVSALAIQFRRWSSTMFDTLWCHDNQAHGLIYGTEGSYQQKRYTDAAVEQIGANTEAVVVNVSSKKVKIRTDIDLPETELYGFDSKVIRYLELWDVQLLEQADGLYLTPWRDAGGQKHAQVGFWGWAGNWFTVIRNGISRVHSINTPTSLPW